MYTSTSFKRIVTARYTPTNRNELFTNLCDSLEAAEWTLTSISNGKVASCKSPQRYSLNVEITKSGNEYINFQFYNQYSLLHQLMWRYGKTYQIIAGCSQLFISTLTLAGYGTEDSPGFSAVCGGIPMVLNTSKVSSIWWSSSDSIPNNPRCPRVNLIHRGSTSFEAGFSGAYFPTGYGIGSPQILCNTTPINVDDIYSDDQRSHVLFWDGSPIYLPAFISWGITLGSNLVV